LEPKYLVSDTENLEQLLALKSDPPRISLSDVNRLSREQYGLQGRLQKLAGERDCNFLLNTDDGRKLILKFSHPDEDPEVLDFQCQALSYIAIHDPQIVVPRIHPTLNGLSFETVILDDGESIILRAQTLISGAPISEQSLNQGRLRQIGIIAARLDLALHGFYHPAAQQKLAWDLVNAGQLLPCTAAIEDSEVGELVERVLVHFASEVKPALSGLREQVIHADLHFGNLHVEPEQAIANIGVVDFGDMLQAPLVVEVSTALAEVATYFEQPLPAMAQLLAGYESILPLETAEQAVLHSCIMTRLAITYAIFSWRLVNQGTLSPDYDGFEKDFSRALTTLDSIAPEQFPAALKTEI
jgi:hydroxylysine kinase